VVSVHDYYTHEHVYGTSKSNAARLRFSETVALKNFINRRRLINAHNGLEEEFTEMFVQLHRPPDSLQLTKSPTPTPVMTACLLRAGDG